MRRARVVLLGILALLPCGCLHDRPVRSNSFAERFRSGPTGPDAVFIEYTVIERAAGNADINRQIWTNIDEMIIDSDTRALLNDNGLRAGVVGGILPPELEAMIANPKSETGHRKHSFYLNEPAAIQINGPVAQAEYQYRPGMEAKPVSVKFDQARFSISFTPSRGKDGQIVLHCQPEVEYQDKKYWLPAGAVAAGWMGKKPIERCSNLAWDLKLSPRQFLIIGSYYERGPWIGNQIFAGLKGNEKVQRLLIVRAGQLYPSDSGQEPNAAGKDNIVPLAGQAFISAARGSRP